MEEELKTIKINRGGQIDMLNGPLLVKMILFALPIAFSSILQQLFNSADVAVLSIYENSSAQAAVTSNAALINLLINLFVGLSVGSTVVIASYIGKKESEKAPSIALTSLILAVVSGLIVLAIGVGASKAILRLMGTPSDVIDLATIYLRIYFAGMPFFMVYNFGSAILRSVGDTKRPLLALAVAGVINVALNFAFVAGVKMGVAGVALATIISEAISAFLVILFLLKTKSVLKIKKGDKPSFLYIKEIIKIGVPSGLQGVIFSVSNILIQSTLNTFGAAAMAGNGAAQYFDNYCYFFVEAFSATVCTFMSQNFAAKQYKRSRKILWLGVACGFVSSAFLAILFFSLGKYFMQIYTHDQEVIQYGLIHMKFITIFEMLPAFYEIFSGALRGMKHSAIPAIFTIFGSCIVRIIWIYCIFPLNPQLYMLLIIYPITWVLTAIMLIITYFIIRKKDETKGLQETLS